MWKRWWPLLLLSFASLLLLSKSLVAHGVRGLPYHGKAWGVEVFYSDGTPMAYARVKIYFGEEKIPFQTGVTDPNGRFLFAPDRKGVYRILVDDGEGHRLEMKLTPEEILTPQAKSPNCGINQTLLGLGILGIIFLVLFKAKKANLF